MVELESFLNFDYSFVDELFLFGCKRITVIYMKILLKEYWN